MSASVIAFHTSSAPLNRGSVRGPVLADFDAACRRVLGRPATTVLTRFLALDPDAQSYLLKSIEIFDDLTNPADSEKGA